jgi:hypothetical protein
MAAAAPEAAATRAERPSPPVTEIGMASIALVACGVIYVAAYAPRHAPLGPAIGILVAAVLVLLANVIVLARLTDFAWWRFFQVARWTLLAYVVIAGMILYAFVYDHMRGSTLTVMTLLLITFTLNVPILLAFTVARFQDPRARPEA